MARSFELSSAAIAGPFAFDDQTASEQISARLCVFSETIKDVIPGIGCISDLKALAGCGFKAASIEVFRSLRVTLQAHRPVLRDATHQAREVRAFLLLALVGSGFTRHFEPGSRGEFLDGLREAQSVVVDQKAERGSVRSATKAVIELLIGAHPKRSAFFIVKWAAGLEFAAGFLEWNTDTNEFDDVGPCDQLVDEALRNSPAHGRLGYGLEPQPAAPSLLLMIALTALMSARPAARVFTSAMTLPMSLTDAAPVSVIAAATNASTSACESGSGM